MLTPHLKSALAILAASASLSACTSYGSPYGGSSIGVGVGVGSGYGYGSPYGYGYGGHYGYSPAYYNYGGHPYFGWYDGFYYPGAGYWVYDPWGRQFRITPRQSQYWGDMMRKFRERRGETAAATANFSGFRAKAKEGATIKGVDLEAVARADAASMRKIRDVRRQAVTERQQAQSEQRAGRSEARSERQQTIRERVIERRRARSGGGG